MWSMLGTFFLGLLRWVIGKAAKKKLSDKQFIEFIEAHQQRRLGSGKTANDFEDALVKTLAKMDAEDKESSNN